VRQRRQLAERACVADEDVELLAAFEDRRTQAVDAVVDKRSMPVLRLRQSHSRC